MHGAAAGPNRRTSRPLCSFQPSIALSFARGRKKERKKEEEERVRDLPPRTMASIVYLEIAAGNIESSLEIVVDAPVQEREWRSGIKRRHCLPFLPPLALSLSCPRLDETLGTRGPNDRLVLSLLPTQPLHSLPASLFRERFLRGSGSVCLRREIEREPSVIRLQDNGRGEK